MKKHLVGLLITAGFITVAAYSQAPAGLEGKWEGALVVGPNQLRVVLNITRASDGIHLGTLTSVDQGGVPIPMDVVQLKGDAVRFEVKAVNGIFQGTLSQDKKTMKGNWTQGGPPLLLELTRTADVAETPRPPSPAAVAAAAPFGIPVEMTVPVPPAPFQADGKTHLVYELHVTNFAAMELLINKLEVLNGEFVIAAFEGAELNNMLQRPGAPNLTDNRMVGPGLRAIAYLWISLDPGLPAPAALRHRITGKTLTVTGPPVPPSAAKPVVLGPPLRGADWIAINGPSNTSFHRRATIPLNGEVQIAQRFAIDWLQVGANGRPFDGDEKDNKTYRGYGNEILAVADAVVSAIKDGIPENVPGLTSRAVPINLETIGGNYVILDLGGNHFAFYAHMQPGSLRVMTGDRVRRGQVIGLVGNSGNSTAPHLHFHVSDGNSPLESEGLPYLFESFQVQTMPGVWELRQNQLPLQNARVRFPDVK